jgi:hypothetical protein
MTIATFLFALACAPTGSIDVGPGNGTDDTSTNTDDTGDVEPDPYFAAGEYDGEIGWFMPEWDWELCDGDMEITVDDEGNFEGSETCIYVGQRGDEYPMELSVDGVFDDDGDATGTIVFETWAVEGYEDWYLDELEAELDGGVDGDAIDLEFSTESNMGDYYGDVAVEGWISVQR